MAASAAALHFSCGATGKHDLMKEAVQGLWLEKTPKKQVKEEIQGELNKQREEV